MGRSDLWRVVSREVRTRSVKSCQLKWIRLNAASRRSEQQENFCWVKESWQAEDMKRLQELVALYGRHWNRVGEAMGKDANLCRMKFDKMQKESSLRLWSEQDQERLVEALKRDGFLEIRWSLLAAELNKTERQCQLKVTQLLKRKGRFTSEEDFLLEAAYQQQVKELKERNEQKKDVDWSAVARGFNLRLMQRLGPNPIPMGRLRSARQCQDRLRSLLAHRWHPEERSQLEAAVSHQLSEQHRFQFDWEAISASVAGRSVQECRDEWFRSMGGFRLNKELAWSEKDRKELAFVVMQVIQKGGAMSKGVDWLWVACQLSTWKWSLAECRWAWKEMSRQIFPTLNESRQRLEN